MIMHRQSLNDSRLNLLEVYFDIEEQLPYYECSDFPFNFYFITKVQNPVTADKVNGAITYLTDNLEDGMVANWVVTYLSILMFQVSFPSYVFCACSWGIMTTGEWLTD